jgi:hypothetical protein
MDSFCPDPLDRRQLLVALMTLAGCDRDPDGVPFAKGRASIVVPSGYQTKPSEHPDGIVVQPLADAGLEVRMVYQSMHEQAKLNPRITTTFLNGYAGTFGAEQFKLSGPSIGALVQLPTNVGTEAEPAYESFGAVAFPEAVVTFRVAAPGRAGQQRVVEFNKTQLRDLLAGLRAS